MSTMRRLLTLFLLLISTTVSAQPTPSPVIRNQKADCSADITLGLMCVENAAGTIGQTSVGDGTLANILSTGGAAATPTANAVFTQGKIVNVCTVASPCQFGDGTVFITLGCAAGVCVQSLPGSVTTDLPVAGTYSWRTNAAANIFVLDEATRQVRPWDIAVNAGTFTVAATTGNTHASCTLDIDGAADFASTVLITGAATFTAAPVFQSPPTYGTTDPLKSLWIPAGAFSISGTCTDTAPVERTIVTNGPKLYTIEPADGDTCSIEADWMMPDSYNAGTITVELAVFSTGNNTTEIFAMDCAAQAVSDGDPVAAHSITGEQEASCTFGAQALDEQHCTTPAITIQGTPAAGDHIYLRCQVDATASTVTPFTDIRILGAKIEYGVSTSTD